LKDLPAFEQQFDSAKSVQTRLAALGSGVENIGKELTGEVCTAFFPFNKCKRWTVLVGRADTATLGAAWNPLATGSRDTRRSRRVRRLVLFAEMQVSIQRDHFTCDEGPAASCNDGMLPVRVHAARRIPCFTIQSRLF
jgi:hypothetical protein